MTFEAEGVSPYQLVKISGDEQQGTFGTALANPLVVEVRDREDNPLPDLQVKFTVTAGQGLLSDRYTVKHVTTDANGRAAQTLTLRQAIRNTIRSIYRVRVSDGFMLREPHQPILPHFLSVDPDNFISVPLSPDGTLLAVGTGEGAMVKLWDVSNQKKISPRLKDIQKGVGSVLFSHDGVAARCPEQGVDGMVKLWDVRNQKKISPRLKGIRMGLLQWRFRAMELLLASGAWDGIVKVWNTVTKENIATLWSHLMPLLSLQGGLSGWFTPVTFSPDSTLLAFGALDTSKQVATLQVVGYRNKRNHLNH